MEKKFKHKVTGEIGYYKDGVFKQGKCCVEIGVEPSSKFWEEVEKYPVGTKVTDTFTEYTYEKTESGKWKLGTQDYFDITDSSIGEGKRFKVVKKEYEILSFKGIKGAYSWNEVRNDYFTNIESVKRLSDNEIFTIGDKITFKGLFGNSSEHKYDTIKGFKFKQNGSLGASYHNGLVGLKKVEKYKEPIFTTYDGVELFGGETIYGVTDDFGLYIIPISEIIDQTWKIFAEKTKAEEYIRLNQPKYSLKDVEDVLEKIKETIVFEKDFFKLFGGK